MSFKHKRGVTLVESLITAIIFGVIVSAIYASLGVGSKLWETAKVKAELQQGSQVACARMKEDLVKISSSAIVDVPANGSWYNTITFYLPESVGTDGMITWDSDTTEYLVSSNQLIRQTGAEQRVIALNLQSFQVRRQSATPNLVEVSLQFSKNAIAGTAVTQTVAMTIEIKN